MKPPSDFRTGIGSFNPLDAPEARLVCCSYAGGSASAYAGWPQRLPPGIEVLAFELPGRGARFSEPAFNSLPAAADHLLALLDGYTDVPFSLYGHSMGAATALELCKRLHDRGKLPERLFVSGCAAPHLPSRRKRRLFDMPHDDLMRELALLGGLPKELLANSRFIDSFLPTIRADMQCREECPGDIRDIGIPIHVLTGRDDDLVTNDDLGEWQRYSSHPLSVRIFEGGHFFINSHRDAVLDHIGRIMARDPDLDRAPSPGIG
ncbi:MAG TPA: alpha/beta fold hydrolase [Arenibaculum sp.]|nr:alpha/beta fold hydrolase [Arenibaculum sp.]